MGAASEHPPPVYAMDRRQRYIEDAIFVRVHQVCERILEALLVELDKIEAALFKADYPRAERHVLMASRFSKPFEATINLLGEMSQIDYSPLRVALRGCQRHPIGTCTSKEGSCQGSLLVVSQSVEEPWP